MRRILLLRFPLNFFIFLFHGRGFLENLGFSQMQGFQVCGFGIWVFYLHAMNYFFGASYLALFSLLHNTVQIGSTD